MPVTSHRDLHSGFTLIELMMVITVSIILISTAMAGFLNFRDRQQVIADTKSIQQLIRSAQTRARLQDVPDPVDNPPVICHTDTNRLQGYRARFNTATTVSLYAACGAAIGTYSNIGAEYTHTLSSGSSLTLKSTSTTYSTPYNFYFFTLDRGTSLPADIQISVSNGTYKYCFTVTQSGVVSDITDVCL